MSDRVPSVGVLGLGTLGLSVAQLVLDHGDDLVVVVRSGPGKIARAEEAIARSLAREVERGRCSEARAAAALSRVRVSDQPDALRDRDVVIECLPEDLAAKQQALEVVEQCLHPQAVIASSTSSLPAHAIGATLQRPGRVAVTHYVWPANRVPLVEVAFPPQVDPDVPDIVFDLLAHQARQPLVTRDVAGFLITRAILAYWNATVAAIGEGNAPSAVDAALERMGWPIGPCRLVDGTGLASTVRIARGLVPVMGERVEALLRLQRLVDAGWGGVATGTGIYRHTAGGRIENEPGLALLRDGAVTTAEPPDVVASRIQDAMVREVERCVHEGVVDSWDDAALAIDLAYGFPNGLLAYASARGFDTSVGAAVIDDAGGDHER